MNRLPPPEDERNRQLALDTGVGGAPPWASKNSSPARDSTSSDPTDLGLPEYWQALRRSKGTILVISFLCALAGFLIGFPQTPVYQARVSLELQGVNENFLNIGDVNPNASPTLGTGEAFLRTQIEILQSESLVERVVRKLKLNEHSEFAEPGRLSAWRNLLGLPPPPRSQSTMAKTVRKAMNNLRVTGSRQNYIIEIFYDSIDPQLAADFANSLTDEYMEQTLEERWNTTQRTSEWLTRQMEDYKIKLEKSSAKLQAYASSSGLVFTSETSSVTEEKLRQLQEELSRAEADRTAKQSQYEMAALNPPESLPEVLDNATLNQYQVRLTDLRRELAELTSVYQPAHPRVKKVQAQISELQFSLEKERTHIIERIRNEYESALRREKLLAKAYTSQTKLVSEQSAKLTRYNILKRDFDTNQQLYDALLQKVKEAGVASAIRASNSRIIDHAKPPLGPYKPDLLVNSILGMFTGVFVGVLFVVIRERADTTLKDPGDSQFYLNVPELGVIPSERVDRASQSYGERRLVRKVRSALQVDPRTVKQLEPASASKSGPGQRTGNGVAPPRQDFDEGSGKVELVTWHRKLSVLAECYRAILTSILFTSQNGDRPQILVVTSPAPGEGKTTLVCNLGIALAEINQRTLLIDADMRRPRLHQVFNLSNSWGLSTLLKSRSSIENVPVEAIGLETEIPELFVLPSGPGTPSIANLLHSVRAADLLKRAGQVFDSVVIDTPPMMQLADARVLGKMADAVILTLRAGETNRDAAREAIRRFHDDGTRVLGSVLNNWNPKTSTHRYYGNYYSRDYYYRSDDSSA